MRRLVAAFVIALGILLVLGSAGYLGFARWSTSRSVRFEYTVPVEERSVWFAVTSVANPRGAQTPDDAQRHPAPPASGVGGPAIPASDPTAVIAGLAPDAVGLFPAQFINPKYWGVPLWAGSDPFGGPGLPDGFERVVSSGQGMVPGTSGPAVRIVIPAIDVDALVRGLEPVGLGDTVAYEPVDKFVGQIPGTANPGEIGTGWYFGHLESPGLGEGNVFHRFPDLPGLIAQDPVDVQLHTDSAVFIYRVVETAIVRAEDLALSDSRESRIALVASFPSRVYTHRLIVFAELFARRLLTDG